MGRGRGHYVRMEFFVGCKSGERKRALCENGVFCWLQEWGEEEGTGEKGAFVGCQTGIFMAIGKIAPKKIIVVFYNVGSILVKLIQF
jgi:hypothetical protein